MRKILLAASLLGVVLSCPGRARPGPSSSDGIAAPGRRSRCIRSYAAPYYPGPYYQPYPPVRVWAVVLPARRAVWVERAEKLAGHVAGRRREAAYVHVPGWGAALAPGASRTLRS